MLLDEMAAEGNVPIGRNTPLAKGAIKGTLNGVPESSPVKPHNTPSGQTPNPGSRQIWSDAEITCAFNQQQLLTSEIPFRVR